MSRLLIGSAALACAALISAPALAHDACSRESLQAAADSYIAAQTAGDPSLLNLARDAVYIEDRQPADLASGILATPIDADYSHTLLDTHQCQTFTEIADAGAPYVLGVHLTLEEGGGAITQVDTLVTSTGDWLFNAANFVAWAEQETWGAEIPEDARDSRDTLQAAADAYLDLFREGQGSVDVPWATPCRRLEGGAYTGTGAPDDSCEVGVPAGVDHSIRDYVIDETYGEVVALFPFGGEGGLPDSHLFRVADGEITNVHTITVCGDSMECPQIPTMCTRDELQTAVDGYLNALGAGNPYAIPISSQLVYRENYQDEHLTGGILSEAKRIDFHHSILDESECQTFTEVVITDPDHPYVLGVHLTLNDDREVSEVDTLVTDYGDWLFNAQAFMDGIQDEDWRIQPVRQRHNRQVLIAAANSYFDLFNDKSVEVPWGLPCYRQEAGARTRNTCVAGVPDGVEIVDRHFVVDPKIGAVVGLVTFGSSELPDSHLFRMESGYITNVHAITVCKEYNCGFGEPPDGVQ